MAIHFKIMRSVVHSLFRKGHVVCSPLPVAAAVQRRETLLPRHATPLAQNKCSGVIIAAAKLAFTRLELLVVMAMMALLGFIVLPALANHKSLGDRVVCLNNLRQIGQAFRLWASDHEDRNPFWTCVSEGGIMTGGHDCPTRGSGPIWLGLQSTLWFQFAWLSNELSTPALLTCPADPEAFPAADFSFSSQGGFMNPGYRNNAVSYFLDLHAYPGYSRAVLAGDSNLSRESIIDSCRTGVSFVDRISLTNLSTIQWLPWIHYSIGNVLINDGRVRTTSSEELQRILPESWSGDGALHLLFRRPAP